VGELIVTIAAHAALGIALALFVWALGAGWLRLGRVEASAFAYPVGLLAAVLAAWLVLVSPWFVPLALVLVAPVVVGRVPLGPFARASPFALGLGLALGGLLHGPTEDESSHAYGDMLFYAAKLVSASESVLPYRDLLVEGESSTYVEAGSSFLGAALPGIDPVLFQAATTPAFLVAALALGLGTLGVRGSLALAPLAVAVVAYPTWITESPPVALALPLAFALYELATRTSTLAGVGAAVVVLGPAFALTKGFGAVPLAVAAAFALRRVRVGRRELVVYGTPVLLVGAAAAAYFVLTSAWLVEVLDVKFLPADALDGLLDQFDRRDTQSASPAFLVLGELLLMAGLVRDRAGPHAVLLGLAIGGNWVVGGHGFDIAVGIGVLFALIRFASRPDPLAVAAGAALAVSCVFRDISGVRAGFVFALLLAGGVVAALVPLRRALLVAAAVALGVAAGYARGSLAQGPPTLTPADYLVWRDVEERVGRDDLVFTSETGPTLGDSREAWNYYPGVAGRRVYLAGWSSSPLLVDDDERDRRLALNADVLAGRRRPADVAPGFERYFAVDDGRLDEIP
jgi:hypothetical protein